MEISKQESRNPLYYYISTRSTSGSFIKPVEIDRFSSWVQDHSPTLAPPAQRLVVGVVVVGIRHCPPTGSSSSVAMAEQLLLLPPPVVALASLLLQLLWGYGHLHRLAVATRPAPPLAARRPRPYHASDPSNALLLQHTQPLHIVSLPAIELANQSLQARSVILLTSVKPAAALARTEEARRRASRRSRSRWPAISTMIWEAKVGWRPGEMRRRMGEPASSRLFRSSSSSSSVPRFSRADDGVDDGGRGVVARARAAVLCVDSRGKKTPERDQPPSTPTPTDAHPFVSSQLAFGVQPDGTSLPVCVVVETYCMSMYTQRTYSFFFSSSILNSNKDIDNIV